MKMRTQSEVVVLVTRKPRQVVHDHEMDLALVRAAVFQQLLKFGTISRLRALAFFLEAFEYVEALTSAVFLAGFQLGGRLRFSVCSFVLTRM